MAASDPTTTTRGFPLCLCPATVSAPTLVHLQPLLVHQVSSSEPATTQANACRRLPIPLVHRFSNDDLLVFFSCFTSALQPEKKLTLK
jgi:hypothetical protein